MVCSRPTGIKSLLLYCTDAGGGASSSFLLSCPLLPKTPIISACTLFPLVMPALRYFAFYLFLLWAFLSRASQNLILKFEPLTCQSNYKLSGLFSKIGQVTDGTIACSDDECSFFLFFLVFSYECSDEIQPVYGQHYFLPCNSLCFDGFIDVVCNTHLSLEYLPRLQFNAVCVWKYLYAHTRTYTVGKKFKC